MATEILGHTVGATANEVALHSMAIMEKFANGEAYWAWKVWQLMLQVCV